MSLIDMIVILAVLLVLVIIFYLTRPKKDGQRCGGCSSDCSSCHSFSNLYEEYKKDNEEKSE